MFINNDFNKFENKYMINFQLLLINLYKKLLFYMNCIYVKILSRKKLKKFDKKL